MRKEYRRQQAAATRADYERCSLRNDAERGPTAALSGFCLESTAELD